MILLDLSSIRSAKKEEGKASILIFTCAVIRAVHLELTHSQGAEEFVEKLNAFITRRTRPQRMVSDNAATFKFTADWIKKLRKSEKLQDFLANQEITWQFNLAKSPWWGGMYERIIKDVKKTLYKTLGRSQLTFKQLEVVIMDIERHLNNRPLTYIESEGGEEQVLTPNVIMWGQNACTLEDVEAEEEGFTKTTRRLVNARRHVWSRWHKEYINSLMEVHRIKKGTGDIPQIGEVVLIIGEEKNRGLWKKGKVVRLVKGSDGVVRGVILLYKGHHMERPLQLICPLEIRCNSDDCDIRQEEVKQPTKERPQRHAAKLAKERMKHILTEEELS